ncbi:hypothetical protein DRO66_03800 [Candidatus Bathyarchaeota archaeon]|nr:MAG: hypothetical protein DRO66_03800 [Candidatus Bathyarchaeota archaeon]
MKPKTRLKGYFDTLLDEVSKVRSHLDSLSKEIENAREQGLEYYKGTGNKFRLRRISKQVESHAYRVSSILRGEEVLGEEKALGMDIPDVIIHVLTFDSYADWCVENGRKLVWDNSGEPVYPVQMIMWDFAKEETCLIVKKGRVTHAKRRTCKIYYNVPIVSYGAGTSVKEITGE